MRHAVAITKNIQIASAAMEAVGARAPGMPGLVLMTGLTGFGKSTAMAFLANQNDALHLRAWPTWTPMAMLRSLAEEVGVSPRSNCDANLREIVKALAQNPARALFIDEADYLADKRVLLETLRSLHDVTTTPIVLVGMDQFKKTLIRRDDQLTNRISQWVEFKRADLDDARALAEKCCEVGIGDDLLAKLRDAVGGSMRGLVVGMARIEQFARRKGIKKVGAEEWGERPFVLADLRKRGSGPEEERK
jgi:hypothetical protein